MNSYLRLLLLAFITSQAIVAADAAAERYNIKEIARCLWLHENGLMATTTLADLHSHCSDFGKNDALLLDVDDTLIARIKRPDGLVVRDLRERNFVARKVLKDFLRRNTRVMVITARPAQIDDDPTPGSNCRYTYSLLKNLGLDFFNPKRGDSHDLVKLGMDKETALYRSMLFRLEKGISLDDYLEHVRKETGKDKPFDRIAVADDVLEHLYACARTCHGWGIEFRGVLIVHTAEDLEMANSKINDARQIIANRRNPQKKTASAEANTVKQIEEE